MTYHSYNKQMRLEINNMKDDEVKTKINKSLRK